MATDGSMPVFTYVHINIVLWSISFNKNRASAKHYVLFNRLNLTTNLQHQPAYLTKQISSELQQTLPEECSHPITNQNE